MPSQQLEVPALPVLLPLGAVLMIISWVLLRRRGLLSARRVTTAWIAAWYAVAVVGATLLPLHLAWGPGAGPPKLDRIILVPFSTMRVDDFLLNIVMTLPLAALLYLVTGLRTIGRVVLAGFALSLTVEITQGIINLAWHGNRWADVNDLVSNTLGTLLGFAVLRAVLRSAHARRAARGWSLVRGEVPARRAHRPDHRPATRS